MTHFDKAIFNPLFTAILGSSGTIGKSSQIETRALCPSSELLTRAKAPRRDEAARDRAIARDADGALLRRDVG